MKHEEVEREVDNLSHKKKGRRRGIGMSKRKLTTIFVVLCTAFVLTASAGILPYFGVMNIEAKVDQSVVWDGDGEWHDWDDPIEWTIEDAVGGCQYCNKTKIWNRCECSGGSLDITDQIWGPSGHEGVTTHYFVLPGDLTIFLDNKDPVTWEPIDDEYIIELTYNPCCPEFDWCLEGKVPLPCTEYVLIYYADQPDRFVVWGGAPALELGIVTSDGNGDISECGTADVTSFPFENDWNIGPEADYHVKDGYNHAKGAKIWLIPTSDYDDCGETLTGWHPENYMFETDLVVYFDCNELPVSWIVKAYFNNVWNVCHSFPYWIQPGEQICLISCVCFDWAIRGGTYNIQTKLVPMTLTLP